jgi:hypothetical protein
VLGIGMTQEARRDARRARAAHRTSLRRVRDFAHADNAAAIDRKLADRALSRSSRWQGLDAGPPLPHTIAVNYGGGPVGVETTGGALRAARRHRGSSAIPDPAGLAGARRADAAHRPRVPPSRPDRAGARSAFGLFGQEEAEDPMRTMEADAAARHRVTADLDGSPSATARSAPRRESCT